MEKNRAIFLSRIRERLREREPVHLERQFPQWKQFAGLSKVELLEKFKERLKAHEIPYSETTLSDLNAHILELFPKYNIRTAVLQNDPRNEECGLGRMARSYHWHVWDPAIGRDNIEITEKADVAITFSDSTAAESGTLVFHAEPGKGRTTHLLPDVHMGLIPLSTLVPRLGQALQPFHKLAKSGNRIPSFVGLVCGSSKSSDIKHKVTHYVVIKDY